MQESDTAAEGSERERRAASGVLVLLGVAVAIGVLFFGAPTRFGGAGDAPDTLRLFLESLGPLAVIEAAAALGAAWLVLAGVLPAGRDAPRRWRVASWLILGLLLLAVLQHLPVPRGLLRLVAPFSADMWDRLTTPDDTAWRPLSLWPGGGFHAVYTLLGVVVATAAAYTVVAGRGVHGRRAAGRVLLYVVVCAALVSAYGIWSTKFGDDTVLGFQKASSVRRVTGTFIAAPTLGVWAGMGACAALALGAVAAQRGAGLRAVVLWGAGAVCAVACFLSLSRMMAGAVGVGLIVLLALLAGVARSSGRRMLSTGLWGLVLAVPAAGLAAVALVPSLRERVEFLGTYVTGELGPTEQRFAAWAATWELFLRAPLFGTGLGSYGRAIHLTQSVDSGQELWYAHSDPLNLLSDAGLVGFGLGVGWLAVLCLGAFRAARAGRDPPADASESRILASGCLAAAVTVAVASLGDFQTQFPVVALPLGALLGAGAGLAVGGPTAGVGARAPETGRGRGVRVLAGLLVALLAVPPLHFAARRWGDILAGWPLGATRAERLAAVARDGVTRLRDAEDPLAEMEAAHRLFQEARTEDPLLAEAHYWDAQLGLLLKRPTEEVLAAAGRARWVSRGLANVNLAVGRLYAELIGDEPARRGPPGDSASAALREAAALDAHAYDAALATGRQRGFSARQMMSLSPYREREYAARLLGKYLERNGEPRLAFGVYRARLRREPRDAGIAAALRRVALKHGWEQEAREIFAELDLDWR